ncbi:hypothetical protein SUGI_0603120 [Cryptomeria japonica]|nr:hypothetical protein SUGI_0603120 [Cryptomeria japonica]
MHICVVAKRSGYFYLSTKELRSLEKTRQSGNYYDWRLPRLRRLERLDELHGIDFSQRIFSWTLTAGLI